MIGAMALSLGNNGSARRFITLTLVFAAAMTAQAKGTDYLALRKTTPPMPAVSEAAYASNPAAYANRVVELRGILSGWSTYGDATNALIDLPNNGALVAQVMAVEPIDEKFAAFGFEVRRVTANDLPAMRAAVRWATAPSERPYAIVCDTVLGFGVPSFVNYAKVHYINAPDEVWQQALVELD